MTKKLLIFVAIIASLLSSCCGSEPVKNELRAPAYPLITIDPYTSAWATTDNLYDDQVKHWTGRNFPLMGTISVDGQLYRFMGLEEAPMYAIAPISYEQNWEGAYTLDEPAQGWELPAFNDRKWKRGEASFGTNGQPHLRTTWKTENIWVRREIEVDPSVLKGGTLFVKYSHDDDCEIFFNGHKVASTPFESKFDMWAEIPAEVAATAADGKILLAAHCHNPKGRALLDMGLYRRNTGDNMMEQTALQTSVDVQATRTIYDFTCGAVDMRLTFTAPLLLEDPELISRPVNYISYEVKSNDGANHDVAVYFEATPDWARHTPDQVCVSECYDDHTFNYAKTGTESQEILGRKGDNVRIDWGYFFLAGNKTTHKTAAGDKLTMRREFADRGVVEGKSDGNFLSISSNLGTVGTESVTDYIMLGYDDLYSIKYFEENIRPYWNRTGKSCIEKQFAAAAQDYEKLMKRREKFDAQLMKETSKAGGKKYAELCVLAYRQAIAAHKLIETPSGELAFLSKECFSNGSIGTVDVTYPSAPMFLYYNPEFAKALINFIFY